MAAELAEAPAGTLDDVYRHIERARSWATEGEYTAAKQAYERVLRQINCSVRSLANDALRARWLQCASALQEECELVNACEKECEALRASTTSVLSRDDDSNASSSDSGAAFEAPVRRPTTSHKQRRPAQEPAAVPEQVAGTPLAMEFDFSRGASAVRTWNTTPPPTLAPAAKQDPDVWSDPPPREERVSPAPSPPSRPRPYPALDRLRDGERSERRASGASAGCSTITPPAARRGAGGHSATPFPNLAKVQAKVNTGATRPRCASLAPGGASTPDAKCAVLDAMLSRFSGGGEAELVEQLGRDIVEASPRVSWSDIAGLKAAKEVLRDHVSLPLLLPEVCAGLLRPARGVLLFGPPGTGKTLLAKAVASQGSCTFFNVSASTLASKYRGESEKLVRLLFEMARTVAPAVIFIDEVDALCSARGAASEHEASRRLKTELLTQMDGMASAPTQGGPPPRVMVLAATNYPWDLDEALRRRLEKRVYIPLPKREDRIELLELSLKAPDLQGRCWTPGPDVDLHHLAKLTEGFSGDDMAGLCREAALTVLRRHTAGVSLGDRAALQAAQAALTRNMVISMADFSAALKRINPSCGKGDVERHEKFASGFGST